ncbi:hypothetical protein [Streptomyces sp. CC224B]|uniref:hypothetical protein n=1 Tax=Streptomyces sp. CC224B TaxID=3044571 RepID=UPI0024A93499|nr:hypothetical protein [Streptomyces sp. CC224B]
MPLPASQTAARVGLTVRYVSHGTPVRPDGSQAFPSVCRAAIVTEVDPTYVGRVGLNVQNPNGVFHYPLADGGCEWLPPADGGFPHPGGTFHHLDECEA